MSMLTISCFYQPFSSCQFPFVFLCPVSGIKHVLSQNQMRIASYCGTYNAFMEIFHFSGGCFSGQTFPTFLLPAAKKLYPINCRRYIPTNCSATQDCIFLNPADSSGEDSFCFLRVCQTQSIPDGIRFWDSPTDTVL